VPLFGLIFESEIKSEKYYGIQRRITNFLLFMALKSAEIYRQIIYGHNIQKRD
jgi:hypothetical protein